MQLLNAKLPDDFYESEIAAGFFKCTEIRAGGVPVYRLVWQITGRGDVFLTVAAVQLTQNPSDINYLGAAMETLARKLGCKSIVFQTARRALVTQCQVWGAQVTGVTMKKELFPL
jgi:hypothetical protein